MMLAVQNSYTGVIREWAILRNGVEVRTETMTRDQVNDLIRDLNQVENVYSAEGI
ncbi:hypothetical protein KIH74_22685 [Kineosporia sp. J2-2]|uniref:Uncharacterized protein n=1 Tax=Kineosporia corallincola TaxID=2835133 RepID=A0ABS5TKY2_9ACTN|nr:hypothetical protein [Kineosporia corallincola]MBT0771765.1 hypothetical protein [Kineosporia corallincola]